MKTFLQTSRKAEGVAIKVPEPEARLVKHLSATTAIAEKKPEKC